MKTLIVCRDGVQVLSGSSDGTVRLWSIGQQRCIVTRRFGCGAVWSLEVRYYKWFFIWSWFLSGSSDGTVRLWSIGQQRCIVTRRVGCGAVWSLEVGY